MKINIQRIKSPRLKEVSQVKKGRVAFRLPRLKMPSLKLSSLRNIEEAHFAVMIIAFVAVIAVVGLFVYAPTMSSTSGAVVVSPVCERRCGPNETPVSFTYVGSGHIECLCKKLR